MSRHGKQYVNARAQIDRERVYTPLEAIRLLKGMQTAKFDETVETHFNLGLNVRHADQQLRGTLMLPHGTGREMRVAVFAEGDTATEARDAGADVVGSADLATEIEGGFDDFDIAIATPDMMGVVGRLGRILGRRGLMPNPKSGTITFDLERAIKEVKSGRVEFKVDKAGIIHTPFGKTSFEPQQLTENLAALVDAVNRARPSAAKGQYFKSLSVSATMGPGIRVDVPAVLAAAVA